MVRSLKNPKKAKRKNKDSKKGDGSSSSSSIPSMPAKVWQPGVDKLEEGEELQCEPSAYNSLHAFHIGWPCLSFDVVRDTLGLVRTEFPHTVYFVAGTQAEKPSWNSIGIFKVSNITGKRRELVPSKPATDDADMESESSDSDEDGEDEELGGSGTPILQLRKVAHKGCINRIRAMSQNPHICASWADDGHVQQKSLWNDGNKTSDSGVSSLGHENNICITYLWGCLGVAPIDEKMRESCLRWFGHVQRRAINEPVWDFSSHLNSLAESESQGAQGASSVFNQAPLMKFKHKDEGYAIDWSPLVPGKLVSGDCKNCIYLWEPTSGATWNVDATPFIGHAASVEDLQWSPTEPHVFASCSVDGTIAIWDTRLGKSAAASFKAHNADVNVISWNRLASCMLASGSDDGTFSIRDLRLLKDGDSVVAHFEYHKHPITSIEWSAHEASTLAVSSSDNQLTIWDLSLEKDEEEEAEFKAQTKEQVNAPADLPPQLLFVHQGQKDLKELHWHSQIPGMIVSTAADGFNILMPSNIQTTLPSEGA
uniref:Histone-binding protein RBBP4-like N-terminal domain-containing protein n=1 Tax=Quercus lobata TaxID=97700 RepID=A0A7N2KYI8_QUELO